MITALVSLTPIFLLIALGFGLRKIGFLPAEQWRGIELVCYWLLFPAMLILTLARAELAFSAMIPLVLTLAAMIVLMTLLMWMLRRPLQAWLGVDGPAYTSIFQTVTRWNGFVAFAIIDKLYGHNGLAILAIAFAIMVPYLNVVNILVLVAYTGKTRATPAMVGRALVRNPLLWAIFTGLMLKAAHITLPASVLTTLELLGRGALGIALLALGAGLSWRALHSAGKAVGATIVLRLIISPLVAAACAFAFHLSGPALVIAVLAAGVPTAVNGYVLARAMGGDAGLYAAASTAQVLASFITLPVLITLAMRFS